MRRLAIASWILYALLASVGDASGVQPTNYLEIRSVAANGKNLPWHAGQPLILRPSAKGIGFGFGPATNSNRQPIRLRYKLEGYDSAWHEGGGDMFFSVRFLDKNGDLIGVKSFKASGDSAGWNGSLNDVSLTHRRELLTVPARASRLQVVISSAGPPSTVGIYIVDDLIVSRLSSSNSPSAVLLRSPFGQDAKVAYTNQVPAGWIRDGTRPGMAKIVELGRDPAIKAFAILDEDGLSHAEWRNLNEIAPQVSPGEQILAEWNEAFTIGVNDVTFASYAALPSGEFRFRVSEATALGHPIGAEASVVVRVPLPFWKTPWFWGLAVAGISVISLALGRYFTWHRMRREMNRLKQQRLLEQERLRIARNIHDDLGARVTQISLLSGMAQDNPAFPEKARADFDSISKMSRELVSALYETVWTVNPENDNLDALGNYLCQMADQLCAQARLRCRINGFDLPRDIQLSSQIRHHITMAAKEAIHNVIKHSRATEVTLRAGFEHGLLTISIHDNGSGFQLENCPAGNGVNNMKRRLSDLNGTCQVESRPGEGTTVRLELSLRQ